MDEEYLKFEQVKKDIVDFMDCAKKCILPHNELMYNIIINAIEMMIVRMEYDSSHENSNYDIKDIICSHQEDDTCENCNNSNEQEKVYDTSKLSEETKQEIDDIIKDILEK